LTNKLLNEFGSLAKEEQRYSFRTLLTGRWCTATPTQRMRTTSQPWQTWLNG